MTDHHLVSTADAMAGLRRSSHDLRASTSHDKQLAAETLLDNATAALDEGDVARARKLVQRVKALGHDEHEDAEVCSMATHMRLFTLVMRRPRGGGADGVAPGCRRGPAVVATVPPGPSFWESCRSSTTRRGWRRRNALPCDG